MTIRAASYQVLIRISELEPPVWRRVIISSTMTLHELHRAIQIVFSWYDYHLYEFEFGGRRFAPPNPDDEVEDSTQVRLADLKLRVGAELQYTYDFGDDWVHVVTIERMRVRAQDGWIPFLLEGERRGPPEDCGGPFGYMELLALLDQPRKNLSRDDRERLDWLGRNFDPNDFSVEQTRHALLLSSKWCIESEV